MTAARETILFAGDFRPGSTARHRLEALRRIGFSVVPFDFSDHLVSHGRIANWLYHRVLMGPMVDRVNSALLAAADRAKPDFVYVEKGVFLKPGTVRRLSGAGAQTVQFTYDNPFGTRRDPGWRLFVEAIPAYDVHLVPRQSDIAAFRSAGAKQVVRMPLTYDPAIHFPPPQDWGEADRIIDVSFTGTPYDNRAEFLSELLTRHGIATDIRGDRWQEKLKPDVARRLYTGPCVYDDAYRRRFWESKICLAFVTHANLDRLAHKSFEIAASGGFLLAEATEEHLAAFEDGVEALFFKDPDHCAWLIREFLPRPDLRAQIARAGAARARRSGYSNDARLKLAFDTIRALP
jgi:hypothetical protein